MRPVDPSLRRWLCGELLLLLGGQIPMALQIANAQKRPQATRVGILDPWPLVSCANNTDCFAVLEREPRVFFARPLVVETRHRCPFPAVLPKLARSASRYVCWEIVAFDMVFEGSENRRLECLHGRLCGG